MMMILLTIIVIT